MRIQAVIIAVMAALLAAGCGAGAAPQNDLSQHSYAGPTGGLPTESDDLDRTFIDMMVPHHQGAVEMALIARQRGDHAEIRQLARSILFDQRHEIDRMKEWRKEWFGSSETPPLNQMPMVDGMEGHHDHTTMDMAADVAALRQAGETVDRNLFDLAFIDAMIPHHESAIAAARAVLGRSQRSQVRFLAQAIIADQTREIEQMKRWRQAWFGSAEPRQ